MAKKPGEVAYVHVPKEGYFVSGVPQRDLTQADVDRLGPAVITEAVATGLYRMATKTETADAAKEAEKAEAKAAKEAGSDER